jgi:hypothetical protein
MSAKYMNERIFGKRQACAGRLDKERAAVKDSGE